HRCHFELDAAAPLDQVGVLGNNFCACAAHGAKADDTYTDSPHRSLRNVHLVDLHRRLLLCTLPGRAQKFLVDGSQHVVDPRRGYSKTYIDRKSTRLNSSHVAISYAVFCLKKK